MKRILDTHIHTIPSGHAYSTASEYISQAKAIGLELIAFTDHGPQMPGASHIFHIANQRVIPDNIDGVRILKGVEANIIDFDGGLDIPLRYLSKLDLVIASLHDVVIKPGSVEEHTRALIGAMESGYVDVLGHTGNPAFPIDIDAVVKAAKENHVMIEVNNSSLGDGGRRGSESNCCKIALKALEYQVPIILGSDSHIVYDLGKFEKVDKMLETIGIPESLIVNNHVNKLLAVLKKKRENRS